MAKPRRNWDSLSPSYRARLSRYGITRSQYENGRPLSGARGHGATPEHGLKSAKKNPRKYGDYIRKHSVPETEVPEDAETEAYELNKARDAAYANTRRRLRTHHKYNDDTVRANIYGGITAESGDVPGMSLPEARWTANADTEELRGHAFEQYRKNPWFYH